MEQYAHPLWTALQEQAKKHGGHGGGDYVTMYEFIKAIKNRTPFPQDVYDAATWSAIFAVVDRIRGPERSRRRLPRLHARQVEEPAAR